MFSTSTCQFRPIFGVLVDLVSTVAPLATHFDHRSVRSDPSDQLQKVGYPLVNVHITMENHHFNREINCEWAMFNSYVKLPEGIESGVRPLCESRVCKNVRSRAI